MTSVAPSIVATEAAYPPWPTGIALRQLYRLPSGLVALAAFAAYWGIPAIIAAWDGTFLAATMPQASSDGMAALLGLEWFGTLILHDPATTGTLNYLGDRSHLLFSILLGLEAGVALEILRRLDKAMTTLRRAQLPTPDGRYPSANYALLRRLANHPLLRVVSLLLAAGIFGVFLYFCRSADYAFWWGSTSHGVAGLAFAAIQFAMVYFATQAIFLVAAGALMLARLFLNGLTLRPFHPDGCNGLAPVGTLIFLLWVFALLLAGAVFVATVLGYLGLETSRVFWVLAFIATLSVPLAAIAPLAATVIAVNRASRQQLQQLEPALDDLFAESLSAVRRGENADAAGDRLGKLQAMHDVLANVNVWPFNPKALTAAIGASAVQTLLTLNEIVGSAPFTALLAK
jgi:hypothetical protein